MQNVVFKYNDGSYDLALIDFGFAHNWKEPQQKKQHYGTIGYFAPEIFRDELSDTRADVYSLGIMFYTM